MPFPSLVSSLNRLKCHCYSPAPAAVHSLLISPFSFSYLTLFDLFVEENRQHTSICPRKVFGRRKQNTNCHIKKQKYGVHSCFRRFGNSLCMTLLPKLIYQKKTSFSGDFLACADREKKCCKKKNRKRHVDYVDKVYMYRARLIG